MMDKCEFGYEVNDYRTRSGVEKFVIVSMHLLFSL